MRWLYRIALVFGAFVVALFAAVLIVHNYYQTYLANILIARFKARSGLQLIPERSSFRFSTHLVIRLDRPRVLDRNQQILELNRIELACSYHALLFEGGLPLYSIVLDRPALRLFGRKSGLSVAAIPPLNAQAAKLLQENVQRFSGVTRRVIVNNASIVDSEGHLLFDNIFVDAYRKRKIGSTWRAKFDAIWRGAPLTGVKVAGDLRLGNETSDLTQELGHGTVWFWNVPLQQIQVASLHPAGELQGNLFLTIRGDGSASADSAITIRQLQFSGGRLKAPTAPQNVALHLAAQFSEQRLALSRVTLTGGGHPLMQAEGYVQEPYSPNPTVRVKVGDVQIDTPQFKKFAAQIRDAPSWLTSAANQLKAGRLKIVQVGLDSNLAEIASPSFETFKRISALALLQDVAYSVPKNLNLPDVTALDAELALKQGVVTVSQGEAQFGNSEFSTLDGELDFSSSLEKAAYKVRVGGNLSVSEMYPIAVRILGKRAALAAQKIGHLAGMVALTLRATGKLANSQPAMPDDFTITLDARHVDVAFKGLPSDFTLMGGTITWVPASITIQQLAAAAPRGSAIVDGKLVAKGGSFEVEKITVDLHQLPAEEWLPLVVEKDSLAASGPVGGTVVLRKDPSNPGSLLADGRLVLGPGSLQFGFLRAPLRVQAATLRVNGTGVTLDMPGAQLEGHAIDFKVGVADLRKPELRIDATVSDLDLEVMRFVRMPWSGRTEVSFFGNSKASGHIEAHQGHLLRLPMTDLKADFSRDRAGWHVYNLVAHTFKGRIEMDLSGREQDDWIHIKTHAAGIEVGPMLITLKNTSPVTGTLFADADLWGDSNGNFFETLAGRSSIVISEGTLNRFALLSRLLELLDLSQWLTVKFPDPRTITGVPFRTLSGSFAGKRGDFQTNDLQLDGPILKMSAAGEINLADSTVHMQVGIRPVLTVGTVVNKIPIVGPRLKNSGTGILQAYFDVHGPATDPSVTPAPITSIAEAVKRTLFLPVNILLPNAIR